ncbi:hypothetical protein Tco_1279015, partial [Tanacetum coccineum]
MKALLTQHKCESALLAMKPTGVADTAWDEMLKSAHSALILCFGDQVLREVNKETTAAGIWTKLKTLYMMKSLANCLYLPKKLYTFYMHMGKKQSEHIDEFHKLVGDIAAMYTAISYQDQALLLLMSLSSSYGNFVETLLYGHDTLKLEDVSGSGADEYDNAGVIMVMSVEHLVYLIMYSGGSYHMTYKRDYLFVFEEYDD